MKFNSEIENILKDRESGSITLLNRLLNAVDKMLLDPDYNREEFRRIIKQVRRKLRHFAAIENFCADLLPRLELQGSFPNSVIKFISEYRSYWHESPERVTRNFLELYNPGGKSILIHSNSHTLLTLLGNLKKAGYSFNVLQTLSAPGEEGRISFRKLQRLGINSEMINDHDVSRIISKVDMVLMGCDTLLRDQFLNKLGTNEIAVNAGLLSIPFVLITESRKIIQSEDWKRRLRENPLFEWTPLDLVTDTITEKKL